MKFAAPTEHRALVIGVGSAHGIGGQTAIRFAREGAQVVIAGRTQHKLDAEESLQIHTYAGDLTQPDVMTALYDEAERMTGGTINLTHYNLGNNTPGLIAKMAPQYFEDSWRVCAFAGFCAAQNATQRLLAAEQGGTILFTGASASMRGRTFFGAFNSAKGALRLLAHALAKEVGPQGIHVGHVVVDGGVDGAQLQTRAGDFAEGQRQKDRLINLQAIVDAFVFLWKQPPSGWSFEVDVRTYNENW